jgi:hypothetical protein
VGLPSEFGNRVGLYHRSATLYRCHIEPPRIEKLAEAALERGSSSASAVHGERENTDKSVWWRFEEKQVWWRHARTCTHAHTRTHTHTHTHTRTHTRTHTHTHTQRGLFSPLWGGLATNVATPHATMSLHERSDRSATSPACGTQIEMGRRCGGESPSCCRLRDECWGGKERICVWRVYATRARHKRARSE